MRTIPNQTMHTLNKNGINRGFYKDEEKKNFTVLGKGENFDTMGVKLNDKSNIINYKTKKKMFKKNRLDENGDTPQIFKLERYNFNSHDIKGA